MATYDLAYPGAAIDAILNTAYFLQEAGYIFQGSASEYSGTPSKRVWLIAPAGFTGLGLSSAVPQGSIGICLYNGTAWVGKVINVLTLDSEPTRNSQNGVTSGGVAATLDAIAGGIMETFASLLFDDETASADLRTKLSYAVKFSVSDVYQTVTHLNILAATASKAGLLSAADKAKLDSLWSSGYQFVGIATPSTTPISTTSKIFYIATEAGTYFNAVTVTQGINILSWNGSAWSAVQVVGIDDEPTAGSDNLVKSGGVFGELALGAVYDVSAKNPTAGPNSNGKWESLSALLSDANLNTLIPTSVRKGGMSIKYVQSSDNKYVQYRLMSDEWRTDTEDWAIAKEGVYVENPEFVYVKTDSEGKILWAIKTDGGIYYGAGVPQQVIDYIEERIAELSLDEYEDIVAFLNDLEKDDKTLQDLLNEKVDKVEGKSLIDAEYAEGVYHVESPEFVRVVTDNEDRILYAVKADGDFYFGAGVPSQIKDKIDEIEADVENKVDKIPGKGLSTNDYDNNAKDIVDTNELVENPEFVEVTTDGEDKILEGITAQGEKKINIPLDINGTVVGSIDNPEYVQVLTDNDGRVIYGVRKDGCTYIAQSNISDELKNIIDGVVKELNNTIKDVKEELEEDIDNVSAPIFANDAEYNVWRQVQQLRNVKWTPKKTISEGAGIRPAGVEVTDGMPYSSVKECLKYVGIDVSFHTFMTAVNDENSLFYTEKPLGSDSVSAYGINYHGVNSLCYYGSVCSGLVTTALGSNIQWDSWAYQTIKDKFEVLDNQDVYNLKVGDIFSQPGHCGVITKIVRDKNGSIIEWQADEHFAPIHIGDHHNHMTLTNKTWHTNSVWCRYKELYKNTFYKPNPFALADGENLYNIGDFVFIEDSTARNYYRCKTANRDSLFISEHWNAIPAWTANTQYLYNNFVIVSYRDRLYRCIISHTSSDSFDLSKWVEVKEDANEWAAYPYVYNDDIVTFAGDRAAFRSNDLIYINYKKGDYTQMQLYKDSELYKTYNLPNDDSFQINVSSDCAAAGMYKARLTDGTNYSRYTYFEVIDVQVSATYANGIAELTFSSSNGRPLVAQIVEHSGGTLCHKPLTDRDIADGTIQFNPLARLYAERWSNWDGFRNKTDLAMYARVIFEGVYGNVVNEMIYLTTADAITGNVIYPNTAVDLGVISGDRNIILADTMIGNIYIINFEIGENANVSILSGIGIITWKTELPPTLTAGDSYQIKVENGLGNVTKIN